MCSTDSTGHICHCLPGPLVLEYPNGRWIPGLSPAAATSQCRPRRWHKASASEGARAAASSSLRKMTLGTHGVMSGYQPCLKGKIGDGLLVYYWIYILK